MAEKLLNRQMSMKRTYIRPLTRSCQIDTTELIAISGYLNPTINGGNTDVNTGIITDGGDDSEGDGMNGARRDLFDDMW